MKRIARTSKRKASAKLEDAPSATKRVVIAPAEANGKVKKTKKNVDKQDVAVEKADTQVKMSASRGKGKTKPEKRKASDESSSVPAKKQKSKPANATRAKVGEPSANDETADVAAEVEEKISKKIKLTPKSKKEAARQEPESPAEEAEPEAATEDQGQSDSSGQENLSGEANILAECIDDHYNEEDDEDVEKTVQSQKGHDVGKMPKVHKLRQLDEPGVLYVGRLPHGFAEHELRGYFSQFGPVNKVRVSRNKKTGASKHFAFLEMAEKSTAEIIAKTMDNYLLFGHILKVKVVPSTSVHESLWKGANRRFKKVNWSKIQGRRLARPAGFSTWENRIRKEEMRREKRAAKLKEMGYEFDSPALKAVESAGPTPAIKNGDEEKPVKAVEEPAKEVENPVKTIEAATAPTTGAETSAEQPKVVAEGKKKNKKARKPKS